MLRPHEPPPFEIVHPQGRSRVVLVCDHASKRIPEALEGLGLGPGEVDLHIGWDIGAAKVARRLSELLDAPLVLTGYSRLVIDCNRPLHVPGLVPEASGGIEVPGNKGLPDEARAARIATFHRPYHDAITALLDRRARELAPAGPVLLSIHSFTPELFGQKRPWNIGTLYGADARLAHRFLAALRRDPALTVGDNQPYHVADGTDYTIPVHGLGRGILHTALEIRQNGVDTDGGALAWAERIAGIYREIEPSLSELPI